LAKIAIQYCSDEQSFYYYYSTVLFPFFNTGMGLFFCFLQYYAPICMYTACFLLLLIHKKNHNILIPPPSISVLNPASAHLHFLESDKVNPQHILCTETSGADHQSTSYIQSVLHERFRFPSSQGNKVLLVGIFTEQYITIMQGLF
jgi:hypothetical protein